MSESVLAALDPSSSEAGHEPTEGAAESGAGGAGEPTEGAANGGGNAAVSAPAPGQGAGGDAGSSNAAEGKQNLVPHGALHEAREKIRSLTTQIEELRKQPQLSEEDRDLLKDLKAQRAEAQKPKAPEFIEDPKGYIDAKEKAVTEALKQLREADTKRTEAEQQQQQMQGLLQSIATHEQAFMAQTPDYMDAINHVRSIRSQQLKMMYPDATDGQIQQQIGREEMGGAHQIMSRGGNPAEFAYNYAKTLGYARKQAAAAIANGLANGAAHAEPEAKPDKDAVRTLGGGGGAEPDAAPADAMPEFTQALKERFTRKRK